MALADAMSIPGNNSEVVTAFLQQPDMPEVTEEEAAQASFDAAAKSKREEIDTAKSTLETREEQLADNESTTAEKEEMLTEETALLHDDRAYLKDLTGQCEERAKKWLGRTTARAGELTAVSKALEILGGTVLDKEKSSGAGGRTEPEPALVQAPKVATTSVLQVDGDSNDEYHDVVFVQEKEVHQHGSNAQVELRNRAITILSAAAQKLKSGPIALLTMKMAADPFAKVKGLIQKLIERLLSEAAAEATHKGWCDTEIGKAEKDREFRHGDMETLNAEITTLEALKAKLEEERDTLTEEILQLENDLNEATEVRNEDKANNKKTLGDAGEGLEALKEAIKVLSDYYRKAGRNKVLLQASPVDQDMGAEGVDGSAKGAYKGNQAQGAGIIGMLETIKSDFERTVKTTEEEEYKASREFAAFSQETKVSISSKSTGLKNTNNELELTNSNLVAALNDLKETQKLLDSSLEQLEKLRPACVDTGMTYEERVAH